MRILLPMLSVMLLSWSGTRTLAADDKTDDDRRLIGKWKVTTGEGIFFKAGDRVEFRANSKVLITRETENGKDATEERTFSLKGDFFKMEGKMGGTSTGSLGTYLKVTKLTDSEFEAGKFKLERVK